MQPLQAGIKQELDTREKLRKNIDRSHSRDHSPYFQASENQVKDKLSLEFPERPALKGPTDHASSTPFSLLEMRVITNQHLNLELLSHLMHSG